MTQDVVEPAPALAGLRVIDVATLFAGPGAATLLADFGADVIKIEHPNGDPVRSHGHQKGGVGLWWKVIGRNKRAMTLNLSTPGGREVLLRMARDADVIIENFRPGTLERWGLGWDELTTVNPSLILARVTGFGQTGPMARRAGFGTLAEAMSGFAAVNGQPAGPPTLPPFGLADGIASIATALAVLTALRARDATGRGQVIDLAIIEPILHVLGPQVTAFAALGVVEQRNGSRSVNNAPRNIYRTGDERWVAVSTSAQSVAERMVRLVGREDFVEEPWFQTGAGRALHADELDEAVQTWMSARSREEVIDECERVGAAVAPIYDARDISRDPQFAALGTIARVPDEELGEVAMSNVMWRMSDTPGRIGFSGRKLGVDTRHVLEALGYSPDDIDGLYREGAL